MCCLVDAVDVRSEIYGEAEKTGECADEHLEDVRREFVYISIMRSRDAREGETYQVWK